MKDRLVQDPNGGYLANAKACQDSCKLYPGCKKFTFKTGTDPPGRGSDGGEPMAGGDQVPMDACADAAVAYGCIINVQWFWLILRCYYKSFRRCSQNMSDTHTQTHIHTYVACADGLVYMCIPHAHICAYIF